MSRRLVSGVWVIICDWADPVSGRVCDLGADGEPLMFVDPEGGKGSNLHFQCGRHHGIVPQAEKEEFQLPEDHKLNQEVLRPGKDGDTIAVEELEDE